jgi:hypothetical protein
MLRPKKFRPFEKTILFGIALVLLSAGLIGVFLAIQRAHSRLALAGVGLLVLAAIYLFAIWRGRPL